MTGRWVKKRRWPVSHLLRDDKRSRHLGIEVGQGACGVAISVDQHLEDEPTGIDTCDRCQRCERVATK